MNESLDKSFEKLSEKLGVKPHMLDAMWEKQLLEAKFLSN